MKHFNSNEFFDFLTPEDIRIKGTRMGIETILEDYFNAVSPEEIALRYPAITLEQVYATITFYLHNQPEIDQYLVQWQQHAATAWKEQQHNPSPSIRRLKTIKLQRSQSNSSTTACRDVNS